MLKWLWRPNYNHITLTLIIVTSIWLPVMLPIFDHDHSTNNLGMHKIALPVHLKAV